VILLFIVFYQLPDRLAQNMATPFLLQVGFTQTEIGAIQGGIGIGATIIGVLAGGAAVAEVGINRSVWLVGALQILSNLAYYWISVIGANETVFAVSIIIENLAGGMVTAVFVALLMSLCSKQFSATQYALLSSLMAAARDVMVAPAGRIAEVTGWPSFFLLTLVAGIPALMLLPVVVPWGREAPRGAAVHGGYVRRPDGRVEPPVV
jgi:MFS transporter, PAT family, beta-lactamase induction signal transducer AmpG